MTRLAWILALACLPAGLTLRTTWDEPWHEEVVKRAEAFVLARVLAVDEAREAAVCKVSRPLAGADVPRVFTVDGFSLLRLMSYSSGHEPRLSRAFRPGAELYLFVSLSEDGRSYEIATPTAGFAVVDGDQVRATYRHSYHLALVPRDLYERSQTAIFRWLHEGFVDGELMKEMVAKSLRAPPKFVEDDPASADSRTFFEQHAALETFYYLGTASDLGTLEPFLASPHEHVQISAVRALSRIDTKEAKQRLLRVLLGSLGPFAKVQAVAGLRRLDARELAKDLEAALAKLPAEETGFGGDIMDPRVGTRSPGSPAGALQALLRDWRATAPR